VVLGAEVQRLEHEDGQIRVVTPRGEYRTKTVVITAGKGALNPRVLECPGWEEHYHETGGVHTHVHQPEDFRGKRVLLIGGGDSAVDWVLGLKGVAREVTLIHRRPEFRAHKASVEQMWAAAQAGEVAVKTPYEIRSLQGEGGCVARATIFNNDTNEDEEMEVEAVVALLGFKPDLGPIAQWGLELERNTIKVTQLMETNRKLELIATGYGEAAIAVNNAVHRINPKARVNPGHSTNLKIFKQDE
jgi:thioredoxin reductase (NADPH)